MCRKERNLHGTRPTKKQAKKAKEKQAKAKKSYSYLSKDEYNYEQDAYAFFLANEDILH